MNEEQKQTLISMLEHIKNVISDIECMLADYDKCESPTSRKYLGATIMKNAAVLKPNTQIQD